MTPFDLFCGRTSFQNGVQAGWKSKLRKLRSPRWLAMAYKATEFGTKLNDSLSIKKIIKQI